MVFECGGFPFFSERSGTDACRKKGGGRGGETQNDDNEPQMDAILTVKHAAMNPSEMVMRPSSPANPGVPMFCKCSANVLHVLCDVLQIFCKCSAQVMSF